ncbi:MAG: LamG domain-containing protein [Phycisphaerae bacterium]
MNRGNLFGRQIVIAAALAGCLVPAAIAVAQGKEPTSAPAPASAPAAQPTSQAADDWLVIRDGLVYGYELKATSGYQRRVISFEPKGSGGDISFVATRGGGLIPRGVARYDHNFAMITDGGSFAASSGAEYLLNECKRSGELTISAMIKPVSLKLESAAPVIYFGPTSGSPNFALLQQGDKLLLKLRTAKFNNAAESHAELVKLPDAEEHHIVVAYCDGSLKTYLDGKLAGTSAAITGDLSRWRAAELVFGDEPTPSTNWPGKIEGVAIYSRALVESQVQRLFVAANKCVKARKEPPVIIVQAKLKARSDVPKPKDIEPYYQALAVYEYTIEKVKRGTYDKGEIRVAHWVIMERQKLPIAQRAVGTSVELVLEPYASNKQLETDFWTLDTLGISDLPLMFDISTPQR